MKLFLRISFVILTCINIIFASWYVLHRDIVFSADIGRDFFILQEIAQKKLILIGPRSSVLGLFHGPLWAYLNFPAYALGHGNPVVVGLFWILLLIISLIIFYIIAKKLFDEVTASLFVLMTSLYSVYHVNGLFNPHGVFFLLPIFFFAVVRYYKTQKVKFFILAVLLAACMIQFQMAVGIPMFLLSVPYLTYIAIKHKKPLHLFSFLFILVGLASFLLFDVRHGFMMTHFALRQLQQVQTHASFFTLLFDRINIMTSGMEFLRAGPANGCLYVFIIFVFYLFYQIKTSPKQRYIYYSFIYFFVGFFVVSLLNKFTLLYFYVFPLFPFVFLIFCSFSMSKLKTVFFVIFGIIYLINFMGVLDYLKYSNETIIGKSAYSWKALDEAASYVFKQPDTSFGYFVYSPDVLAYEARYAMEYEKAKHPEKTAYIFEKKPVTYLVIGPHPKDNPYMDDAWWIRKQVGITTPDVWIQQFLNGYKVEKYTPSQEDINTPFDQAINPGLHFR